MKKIRKSILQSCILSFILFLSGVPFLSQNLWAGLLFPYHQLVTRNLEQMDHLVKIKLKEAKSAGSARIVPLKEALQAVLVRPDPDNLVEKVISPLNKELETKKIKVRVYQELLDEALIALKNPSRFSGDAQVSYGIFLENLLSRLKPEILNPSPNPTEFTQKALLWVQQIEESNIELSKAARRERTLRLQKSGESPSSLAKALLKERNQMIEMTQQESKSLSKIPDQHEPQKQEFKEVKKTGEESTENDSNDSNNSDDKDIFLNQ